MMKIAELTTYTTLNQDGSNYPAIMSDELYQIFKIETPDKLWQWLDNKVKGQYQIADNGYFQYVYFTTPEAYETIWLEITSVVSGQVFAADSRWEGIDDGKHLKVFYLNKVTNSICFPLNPFRETHGELTQHRVSVGGSIPYLYTEWLEMRGWRQATSMYEMHVIGRKIQMEEA